MHAMQECLDSLIRVGNWEDPELLRNVMIDLRTGFGEEEEENDTKTDKCYGADLQTTFA